MTLPFQLAAGSIVGRKHLGSGNLLLGKPNQDAYGYRTTDRCVVACVHDGCSSAQYAEVGSHIGSEIVTDCFARAANNGLFADCEPTEEALEPLFEQVRLSILNRMHRTISAITGDYTGRTGRFFDTVRRYLQFTTLGVLVTPAWTAVFSVGDGVWGINGEIEQIPAYPNNAPPYLCYDLLEGFDRIKDLLRFHVRAIVPTQQVDNIFLGTDGVAEIIEKAERNIPGKKKVVGPLEQFWLSDQFFAPALYDERGRIVEMITPWLCAANSEVTKLGRDDQGQTVLKREPGLLQDDVTIVVLRRTRE